MRRGIVSILLFTLGAPLMAFADTADIQAQIQSLLQQLAVVQAQLKAQTGVSGVASTQSASSCTSVSRTLSRGMQGNDVLSLQNFLVAQNFLSSANVTGFFGPITESAVQKWQAQNNIVSSGDAVSTGWGVFGPRSIAFYMRSCSGSASSGGGFDFFANFPNAQYPLQTSSGGGATNQNTNTNQTTHTTTSAGACTGTNCTSYTDTTTHVAGMTRAQALAAQIAAQLAAQKAAASSGGGATGILTATPARGAEPLVVRFTSPIDARAGNFMVDVGNGNRVPLTPIFDPSCPDTFAAPNAGTAFASPNCPKPNPNGSQAWWYYDQAGTYTIKLYSADYQCNISLGQLTSICSPPILASTTVSVSEPDGCNVAVLGGAMTSCKKYSQTISILPGAVAQYGNGGDYYYCSDGTNSVWSLIPCSIR